MLDRSNAVVDVTPKALEILCVLVESSGSVVSRDELIKRVWADSFVEEANLSHHISRLRRALGENSDQKFIETVPKRGYRFVAEIRTADNNGSRTSEDKNEVLPPASAENRKLVSRNVALTAAGVLLLILVGTAFLLNRASQTGTSKKNQDPPSQNQMPMAITRVTNVTSVGASSISPDGKFIAFVNNETGNLYLRQPDTNTEIGLIEPAERIFGATAFSGDGVYVYFIAYEKGEARGSLYRVPILGGQQTKVIDDVNYYFTLSSDGKQAAFFRWDKESKHPSIVIGALDGSRKEKMVVTFNADEKIVGSVPAFSPDGQRLAFGMEDVAKPGETSEVRAGLFTVEIDSGAITVLAEEKFGEIGMMNWMPDASGVIFIARRVGARNQIYFASYPQGEITPVTKELGGYGNYGLGITADGTTMVADIGEYSGQIWSIPANGKTQEAVQLTVNDLDGARGLTSLPGGEAVYTSRTGFDYDLWKLSDVNGKREGNPLVSDKFYSGEPAASPDGKFLVFISDRSGGRHLFRINTDGTGLAQLTFGDSVEDAADISPDGNWIVYSSYANSQRRIWKMPIGEGEAARLTDYESVAPTFSPDGKLIALISPSEAINGLGRLDIVSSGDGVIVHSFQVVPFDWYYSLPRWTPDGKAVLFRRTDTPIGNIWKQNLAGGPLTQFTDFSSQKIYYFTFTRDSKNMLVSRGRTLVNVVMLRNFRPTPSQ